MTEWMGLPALAAVNGEQIDGLIGWMHVFMLFLFVGWGGFFLYALFRFRRSRNPVANYTGVRSHASSYLEIAVAVVEAVLLFAFSVPLWAARVDRMRACEGPLKSASRMATRSPRTARALARWNVNVLLPTPPLPDPTATRWRTPASPSAIRARCSTTCSRTLDPPSPTMS